MKWTCLEDGCDQDTGASDRPLCPDHDLVGMGSPNAVADWWTTPSFPRQGRVSLRKDHASGRSADDGPLERHRFTWQRTRARRPEQSKRPAQVVPLGWDDGPARAEIERMSASKVGKPQRAGLHPSRSSHGFADPRES